MKLTMLAALALLLAACGSDQPTTPEATASPTPQASTSAQPTQPSATTTPGSSSEAPPQVSTVNVLGPLESPAAEWTVDPKKFISKGRNTPYGGRTLTGRVHYTIVGGRVVHRPAQG